MAFQRNPKAFFLLKPSRIQLLRKSHVPPRQHSPHIFRMASTWTKLAKSFVLAQEPKPFEDPRSFPTTGFKIIDNDQKVEEEELPDYRADRFYPVRLGEVFHGRYQAVTKLGFGSSSTIWLARDLRYARVPRRRRSFKLIAVRRIHEYVALKIYVHSSRFHRELPLYEEISPKLRLTDNPGRNNIRRLLDSFEIGGPNGKHIALVFQPAQMSLRDMKHVFRQAGGFDEIFVKGAVEELLKGLDFLHREVHVVHTGMSFCPVCSTRIDCE